MPIDTERGGPFGCGYVFVGRLVAQDGQQQGGRMVGLGAGAGEVIRSRLGLALAQAGLEQVRQGVALVIGDANQPPWAQVMVIGRGASGFHHLYAEAV